MVPLNPEKVLERIPSAVETQQAARHQNAALLQRLEVRFCDSTPKKPKGKKVPAGQSSTHVDEEDSEEDEEDKLKRRTKRMMTLMWMPCWEAAEMLQKTVIPGIDKKFVDKAIQGSKRSGLKSSRVHSHQD
jgi:hypothetical protein